MSRPKKSRKVCRLPLARTFNPSTKTDRRVILTVDEYECIRLIDYQGFSQEECSFYMQVSRATVQLIYDSARKKIASALVNGRTLCIEGGNYRLCDGDEEQCGCGGCKKHLKLNQKGVKNMRIAVTYENEMIFQHFGHTEKFKIYDVENDEIKASSVVDTNGRGHGALASFLKEHDVDVLICGGIGGGAQAALAQAGIRLFGGADGLCDNAVRALLCNELAYNPDVKCSHHEHEHADGNHACGSHGCGGHCHN